MARTAVEDLFEDIRTGATTDRHLADQVILFGALAAGRTEYVIPRLTDHVESNLWLVEQMLGARTRVREHLVEIEGTGFFHHHGE